MCKLVPQISAVVVSPWYTTLELQWKSAVAKVSGDLKFCFPLLHALFMLPRLHRKAQSGERAACC